MSVPLKVGVLQRGLFRALDVLERKADPLKPWRVIPAIVLVGLCLTTLAAVAVWTAERQREAREFDALAAQKVAQVSDRLTHRRWKLERLSERWTRGDPPTSLLGGGFGADEVRALRRDAPVVAQVSGWQRLTPQSTLVLARFVRESLGSLSAVDGPVLTPPLQDASGRSVWLMVKAAPAGDARGVSAGWFWAVVDDASVLPRFAALPGWASQVALSAPQAAEDAASAQGALQQVSALDWADGPASVGLRVWGQAQWDGWQEGLVRHLGWLVAAVAGGLCTLGAVYGYLLLISIRLRAQALTGHATAELRREESRNRAVLDTAPDAIVMVDDQCQVIWCNQATVGIFGRTLEELRGQGLSVVLPVLDGSTLDDWFREYGIANRVLSFETHGKRAEGTEFPIAVSASRTELNGDVINTFTVRDTTDAKWAEHELLLRERALASSADAITICDMSLPGGPIIFANASFERITGYEFHEVLGLNPKLLYRDDVAQSGVAEMLAAMAEGRACKVVLRNYRKDGQMFWNEQSLSPVRDAQDKITHYVGVASDITARMAAEQVLYLRTERLNAVFDLSPDGFVVLDRQGVVSIANPAFERMTGLSAALLVGRTHDELEQQLLALCSFIEHDNETHDAHEIVDAPGDGRASPEAPALGRRELLHLQSPSPRTLVRRVRHGADDRETVMYFRDITRELEVDRMKSEFLSMAAHELRTPMASIFGFTELLLRRKFDEARRQDMLSTIHRQASILINLINELLDLARIESRRGKDFKRQRQVLQPLIEATVHGLLMNNDRRQVLVSLPAEPIDVDVDGEKLSSAITNVLSNAYKYSPAGGDIELDLVWRDHQERLECGIRVTDHGIGMTGEQLARVFERFFRADTSGNIPGTGLGMTIVKEIVELHGGEVLITSQSGVGTTVVLWLPVLGVAPPTEREPLAVTLDSP